MVGMVRKGHDRPLLHVAEQRDLVPQVVGHRVVAAADDDVGLDAHAAQLANAVLGGLGLQLAGGGDVGQEGYVDSQGILPPLLFAHLADGLQEGLALDVAHGAPHLHDDHAGVALLARQPRMRSLISLVTWGIDWMVRPR